MNERRFQENPFFILGLPHDAPQGDIEREGRKLLGQLELGVASAKTYATPLGPQERTPDRVRDALAALRDSSKRLTAEIWAKAMPRPGHTAAASAAPEEGALWPEAFQSAGLAAVVSTQAPADGGA
jgi:hypothetical protein